MELKRKIEEQIWQWYRNSRKALLVEGARQVGKTHVIRKVLNEATEDWAEFNLIETPELVPLLENAKDINELTMGLSAFTERHLVKNRTVIFIDEVQMCKEMVTRIKFFVEEGSYRYVLSGSLLGVELRNISSAPVGYMDILEMYPLDFEEFLQTTAVTEQTMSYLLDCFNNCVKIVDALNDKLLQIFRYYLVVGGMPEAVVSYVETHNLNDIMRIHSSIASLYKMDFTKYEEENKRLVITGIYELIPSELLKQNRRFIVGDLKKGMHFDRVCNSFLWLEKAGVTLTAYNATEPRLPLRLNEKSSLFKLYMSDVGMLTSQYGLETKRRILINDKNFNAGGLYENAVIQALASNGIRSYYYNSSKVGELDFVIEYNGSVLPIEVKSGKDYTVHSALNAVMSNPQYEIAKSIVFADCNISVEDSTVYYPVYMSMFLRQNPMDNGDIMPITL